MTSKKRIHLNYLPLLLMFAIATWGCNGLETDISKKPEFQFFISVSDTTTTSSSVFVDIPNHSGMVDFTEYAVFPDPFTINELSYRISEIFPLNTAQFVDIDVSYRNVLSDTIQIFRVEDTPLMVGDLIDVDVSDVELANLSQLVNDRSSFQVIVEITGDTEEFGFILEIYFDTTIAIDYDL